MARISRSNPTKDNRSDSTRERNYQPIGQPVYDAPSDSSEYSDSVASKVKNSAAYRNAYALFANDPDQSWLQRLVAIPESVEDAKETWTDQIGVTTNYADKQAANYQYCMQQIDKLVADYYAFKNSLPETQVQQLADAGINAAITGNGVNGSELAPGFAPTANPSSLQSSQPIDIIQGAASFILDASTGLANIALQYQQLGITGRSQQFNEEYALLEFRKYASEHGTHVRNGITWKDLIDEYGYVTHDPGSESRYSDNILRQFLSHHSNAPYISGLAALYPDIAAIMVDDDGNKFVNTGVTNTPIHLDAVNKSMIDLLSAQREYDAQLKKFAAETAEYNAGKAFAEKTSAEFRAVQERYAATRAEIADELIKKLRDSDNVSDKLLLSRILWNATYNTVELEQKQNEWFTTDLNLGPLGSVGIIPK